MIETSNEPAERWKFLLSRFRLTDAEASRVTDASFKTVRTWRGGLKPTSKAFCRAIHHLSLNLDVARWEDAENQLLAFFQQGAAWPWPAGDPALRIDPTRGLGRPRRAQSAIAIPVRSNIIPLVEAGLERALGEEQPRHTLEGLLKIVREARKLGLAIAFVCIMIRPANAEVAELADALDSGSSPPDLEKYRPSPSSNDVFVVVVVFLLPSTLGHAPVLFPVAFECLNPRDTISYDSDFRFPAA